MLSDLENHAEESRKIIIGILRGVEKEWLSKKKKERDAESYNIKKET
jgi:hypothetical protein